MDLLLLLVYSLIDGVATTFTQADCPHQPVTAFVDGVCFWQNTDNSTNFFGGRKRCRAEGGDLAVIPSTAVLDVLLPESSGPWHAVNLYDAYPGNNTAGLAREWTTTTVGSLQPVLAWKSNNPSGYAADRLDAKVQDCVAVRAKEKTLVTKGCMFNDNTGNEVARPHFCSYDPQEPTHACITNRDCLSNHYQMLHYQYLEGVDGNGVGGHGIDHYGTVRVTTQIECGLSCHNTPDCENIKWNPSSKQCQRLGHLTMVKHPYTDPDWQLWSRYRYYDYGRP